MAQKATYGMSETEIERARNSDDKEVVESEYTECVNCGHNQIVVTYYPGLPKDRTCTSCRHTY